MLYMHIPPALIDAILKILTALLTSLLQRWLTQRPQELTAPPGLSPARLRKRRSLHRK